jgi:hypothetical protein
MTRAECLATMNRRARRQAQCATKTAPADCPEPSHETTNLSPTHFVLNKDTDELWREAGAKAAAGEGAAATPFVHARKLQHRLTSLIEEGKFHNLMEECKLFQRTILRELDHAPQSGGYLHCPRTPRSDCGATNTD